MHVDLFMVSGILGAGVLVLAYFGNLQGWLASSDWRLPSVNLAGSLLILVSLYSAWNLPSVVIELFWASISLYGLVRNLRAWDAGRAEPPGDAG